MSVQELDRIASALGRLLRSDAITQRDADGYVPFETLAHLLAGEVGVAVDVGVVRRAAERGRRFEVIGECVRAMSKGQLPAPSAPDILYHACTADQVRRYRQEGILRTPNGKPVFLSDDESQAWRAAHRMGGGGMGGEPRVLYVDTMRQRRRRMRLQRNRRGLYLAKAIPLPDVLNLQPQFAEQRSAGGIPILRGEDGKPRMALIRVMRKSGVTWEVAKGKLEPGEPPEWAGVREVQEEMGVQVDFEVRALVGLIRYGFLAPGGLPRLKTVYLYLLDPVGDMGGRFRPAAKEGVRDVRWFTPEEACKVVSHSSLRPLMVRAKELVEAK